MQKRAGRHQRLPTEVVQDPADGICREVRNCGPFVHEAPGCGPCLPRLPALPDGSGGSPHFSHLENIVKVIFASAKGRFREAEGVRQRESVFLNRAADVRAFGAHESGGCQWPARKLSTWICTKADAACLPSGPVFKLTAFWQATGCSLWHARQRFSRLCQGAVT